MHDSKFEKYVVRNPKAPDPTIDWGRADLGIIDMYHFLKPAGPIKEANTMVEFAILDKDSAFGVTEEKPPHKHDCDELFMFTGVNPADKNELGAEIEFWMGEGEDTEKLLITTPSLVYVPKGLLHLPLFFRNVQKPVMWYVIATNVGETLKHTIKYPVRGI